jgi:DNA-binding LacI/PurR family transcriptional regulator
MGVLQQANEDSLSIPKDLGVICFDTYPFAPYSDPPLTAVDIDLFELGRLAADALFYTIQHPGTSVNYKMIEPRVVIRRSSDLKGLLGID